MVYTKSGTSESNIESCVAFNILQNWDGNFGQIGKLLVVTGRYQVVELCDIFFRFYKFMQDRFNLRENVETELNQTFFFDLVNVKTILIEDFFNNLPV